MEKKWGPEVKGFFSSVCMYGEKGNIFVNNCHTDICKYDMEKKWGPEFEESFGQVLYVCEKEKCIYIYYRYHTYIC